MPFLPHFRTLPRLSPYSYTSYTFPTGILPHSTIPITKSRITNFEYRLSKNNPFSGVCFSKQNLFAHPKIDIRPTIPLKIPKKWDGIPFFPHIPASFSHFSKLTLVVPQKCSRVSRYSALVGLFRPAGGGSPAPPPVVNLPVEKSTAKYVFLLPRSAGRVEKNMIKHTYERSLHPARAKTR